MDEREIKPHNYKWLIVILIIIMAFVGMFLAFGHKKEEVKPEPKKVTTISKKITEDRVIENLNITNISLTDKNGVAIFSAKVKNLTNNELIIKSLSIVVKDKNDNVLANLTGYFGGVIGPEESKSIVAETNADLTAADDIEISLNE